MTRFTIAICTYNRREVIARALAAALAQNSAGAYEVLVVDNNSTDGTAGVVAAHPDPGGRIRIVGEHNQGLSHARNRAIEEARGEWVVYMDDDAEMAPDYLTALEAGIARDPDAGAMGGPIEVGWLGDVPDWYEPGMDGMFGRVYHASYRMELKYPQILYGSNMVFPVALLKELGGFNPALGRLGARQLACEDGEVLLRIETKTKRRILWEPGMRVVHLIDPKNLTVERLKARAEGGGMSQCVIEQLHPGRSQAWGMALGLVENCVRIALGRPRGKIGERLAMAHNWGYLRQWMRPLPDEFKRGA